MSTLEHLIVLMRNLYIAQQATVMAEYGQTDSTLAKKLDKAPHYPLGIRQGCPLSPRS